MHPLDSQVRAALKYCIDGGKLAGAMALIWHRDQSVICEAAGYRNLASGLTMERDTIFQVASMTKPIVSAAVLQLLDEGRVALDDPITTWLPEFAGMRVLNRLDGALHETHPASRPITIDDLLTHRAGFGYAFTASGPIAAALDQELGSVLDTHLGSDEWLAALSRLPLLSEPGHRFLYGHSTEVLGCLLARIDGCSLGQCLARRILEPLGLRDTAFFVPAQKLSRLARMYRRTAIGFEDMTPAHTSPPEFEAGGGGLYSTPNDYLAFSKMLLGGGAVGRVRVLREETCCLMMSNHLSDVQRSLGDLGQPELFADSGFGYGLQIFMNQSARHLPAVGSASWGGMFGTGFAIDPANQLICLFFSQDFAETSSEAATAGPTPPRPAAELQSEVHRLVWTALA